MFPELVKEISKYFRDFLETDFHKQRVPKRQIRNKNPEGLLTGFPLNKFSKSNEEALNLLNKAFNEGLTSIKKGQYTVNIPSNLIEVIGEKVLLIESETINDVNKKIIFSIKDSKKIHNEDYNKYIDQIENDISSILENSIIKHFLSLIEKPLENLELSDENNTAMMQVELIDQIKLFINPILSDVLKKYYVDDVYIIDDILINLLILEDVRQILIDFFKTFKINDLYDEILEIFNNAKTIDKTEIYLYFYDISFNKVKYPLLFTPISLTKKNSSIVIEFNSPLYINRNAVDFIVQEFNNINGRSGNIKSIDDRIIYLNDIPNIDGFLKNMVSEICDYFEVNSTINTNDLKIQKSISKLVSISNTCYITIFDKSDEAIVNDYEEILTMSGDSELVKLFGKIVENFIKVGDTKNVFKETDEEWNETNLSGKLIYNSPVPLNEEQRKALIALNQDDCKYLIIKGPPGTGKSHTITAIICDYILNNKSVLVISDKEEALDVVEDKISHSLNKIRVEENFQNPIFRIGKTGSRFNQIISGNSLNNIKQHHQIINQKKDEIDKNRMQIEQSIADSLEHEMENASKIDSNELNKMFRLEIELENIITQMKPDDVFAFEDWDKSYLTFVESVYELRNNLSDLNYQIIGDESCFEDEMISEESLLENLLNIQTNQSYIEATGGLDMLLEVDEGILDNIEGKIKELQSKIDINDNILWYRFGGKTIEETKYNNIIQYLFATKEIFQNRGEIISFIGTRLAGKNINYFGNTVTSTNIEIIKRFIRDINNEKNVIFGYLFSGKKIKELNNAFRMNFPLITNESPHKDIMLISELCNIFDFIITKRNNFPIISKESDYISIITNSLSLKNFPDTENSSNMRIHESLNRFKLNNSTLSDIYNWISLVRSLKTIKSYTSDHLNYADLFKDINKAILDSKDKLSKIQLILDNFNSIAYIQEYIDDIKEEDIYGFINNPFFDDGEEKFKSYVDYLNLLLKYRDVLKNGNFPYLHLKNQVEELMSVNMAHIMDGKIIDFYNQSPGDVNTLKQIIKNKRKFPKELAGKLKNAFPCIIANIRTYSDFIPLEFEMFDLVIIDEASQVSVAQALPSLFRAKKVIVLGDEKQFSNVKTSHASGEVNTKYVKQLVDFFKKDNPSDTELTRFKKFDIKSSILDFLSYMRNYEVDLRKHFRGYKELISFSNKYFYQNGLQVMKIRGKNINEVFEFTFIENDGKLEATKNTNKQEADFIVIKLLEHLKSGSKQSIGIITPHTQQQIYLSSRIKNLPERDDLYEKLKLKIMTFDTCQGEERDIIIYSMVATPMSDQLGYIFIKDLNIGNDGEDKIKAQRLNVGLSRAKEKMWFVLSKPIDQFSDCSIKLALNHYYNLLNSTQEIGDVDPNSPMETNVLHWIMNCKFFLDNEQYIEIRPQFDIGVYLKQLDPFYNHPKYKVDFLVMYNKNGTKVNLVIEYDGFKEHFSNLKDINAGNFDIHYKDDDIYRQKILESYNYYFLRINKFNLGDNPIETISQRLEQTIGDIVKNRNSENEIIQRVLQEVSSYQNGDKKLCAKCGEVKDLEYFKDETLASGEGRFCIDCKMGIKSHKKKVIREYTPNEGSCIVKPENKKISGDDKIRIINQAIANKSYISITYRGKCRKIRPTYLGNMAYRGYGYYGLKAIADGSEINFSFDKIKDITAY